MSAEQNFLDNFKRAYFEGTEGIEQIKLLLQDPGVDPSVLDNEAIVFACRYTKIEIVKLLLQDPRVDPSAQNNEAIIYASKYGHTELVKLLLQDPRVDPSACDNRAIIYACEYGQLEIVKMLLHDPRVDPSARENSSILKACRDLEYSSYSHDENRTEIIKLLLQDPRVDPNVALFGAYLKVDKLTVLICDHRADIQRIKREFPYYPICSSDGIVFLCRKLNLLDSIEYCKTLKTIIEHHPVRFSFLVKVLLGFKIFRNIVSNEINTLRNSMHDNYIFIRCISSDNTFCYYLDFINQLNSSLMGLFSKSFIDKSKLPDEILCLISTFVYDVSIKDSINFSKNIRKILKF